MLESAFRANMGRLYGVYHSMPYPVQNFLTSARGLLLAKNRYLDGWSAPCGNCVLTRGGHRKK